MNITTLKLGDIPTNTYIADDGRNCVVIDPAENAEYILGLIKEKGLELKAVLLTHGHFDHIGGVDGITEKKKVPVYIHKDDEEMLGDADFNGSLGFGLPPVRINTKAVTVEEGQVIEAGNMKFTVLHTPGHSKGSVCYDTDDGIFTGDTMFDGGYGRTDLHGGSFHELRESLARLFKIRKEKPIYPGH